MRKIKIKGHVLTAIPETVDGERFTYLIFDDNDTDVIETLKPHIVWDLDNDDPAQIETKYKKHIMFGDNLEAKPIRIGLVELEEEPVIKDPVVKEIV
jgi:hypothetical protein